MRSIWLDVSPLMAWEGAPTGIPRVILCIIREWCRDLKSQIHFCQFDPASQSFSTISAASVNDQLRALEEGTTRRSEPSWKSPSSTATPSTFATGDVFFEFGGAWAKLGYHEALFRIKMSVGLKIGTFIHDLIPYFQPQFFWTSFTDKFVHYLVDTLWTSDFIICNSRCTENDLKRFSSMHSLPSPTTSVVRLGDENLRPKPKVMEIFPEGFVLCVGTIEPRKNHMLLYQAWKILASRYSQEKMPRLILVGGVGWKGDFVEHAFSQDPDVQSSVRILNEIADDTLEYLYQQCLFTIYPSFYEGWGLPIAESLAHGKLCICSSTSSMKEIAPGLVDPCNPLDPRGLAQLIERAYFDSSYRNQREAQIRSYEITPWSRTAESIMKTIEGQL